MLPKHHRLPASSIRNVLKRGVRISNEHMSCVYIKNQKEHPRFAFVVAKKHEKTAVNGTKTKRMLRSAIGALLLEGIAPVDSVIITKKPLSSLSYQRVFRSVEQLLTSSRILTA